jgi:hypothetical protein
MSKKRANHEAILESVRRLNPEEQLELLGAIASTLREALIQLRQDHHLHSLLELKGLGKEIWRGVDAQKYINRERNSWHSSPK